MNGDLLDRMIARARGKVPSLRPVIPPVAAVPVAEDRWAVPGYDDGVAPAFPAREPAGRPDPGEPPVADRATASATYRATAPMTPAPGAATPAATPPAARTAPDHMSAPPTPQPRIAPQWTQPSPGPDDHPAPPPSPATSTAAATAPGHTAIPPTLQPRIAPRWTQPSPGPDGHPVPLPPPATFTTASTTSATPGGAPAEVYGVTRPGTSSPVPADAPDWPTAPADDPDWPTVPDRLTAPDKPTAPAAYGKHRHGPAPAELAAPGRAAPEPDTPVVRLTVGRLEVRAAPPRVPGGQGQEPGAGRRLVTEPGRRSRPAVSLDEYLRRREARPR